MIKILRSGLLLLTVLGPTIARGDASERQIRIGLLSAMSGYSVQQGTECRQAFDLARSIYAPDDKAHGYQVSVVYGDSQRKAKPALSEFKRMLDINRVQSVAFNGSPVGMAVNPISKQRQVPVLGVVGHHDFKDGNPFAFRVWPSAPREGGAIAEKILADGKKRLAVLTAEDDWTLAMRKAFLGALKGKGIEVVYDVTLDREDVDFAAYVTKLRVKKPDAVLINLVVGQPGLLLKKLRELGVDAQVYGTYFAGRQDEVDVAGASAEGMIVSEIDFPEDQLNELARKKGIPRAIANGVSYNCYVSGAMLVQALANSPTIATAQDYFDALTKLKTVEALGDVLPIEDREVAYSFTYKTVKDGQFVRPAS